MSFVKRNKIGYYITHNRNLKPALNWYVGLKESNSARASSIVRTRRHCILSNRKRSVYRFARLSRLFLREPLYIGTLPGLRKLYY